MPEPSHLEPNSFSAVSSWAGHAPPLATTCLVRESECDLQSPNVLGANLYTSEQTCGFRESRIVLLQKGLFCWTVHPQAHFPPAVTGVKDIERQQQAKAPKQEQQAKPEKQQQQAKAPKQEQQAKPEKQQQQAKAPKQEQQAKPEKQQQQAKAQHEQPQKQQQEQAKSNKQHNQQQVKAQQEQPGRNQQQAERQTTSSNGPQRTQEETATQQAQPELRLSSRGSGRIPDERFRSHFGRGHEFRMGNPVIVSGYSRFQYGGYWFGYVQPWPAGWYYTDEFYIDYVDGSYYMYNPYYPGTRFAITVVI